MHAISSDTLEREPAMKLRNLQREFESRFDQRFNDIREYTSKKSDEETRGVTGGKKKEEESIDRILNLGSITWTSY